jgi:glutathione S-transferase
LSDKAQQAAKKLLDVAGMLIDEHGNNLFGQWSIADADLAITLDRLVANGDAVPDKIKKYVHRQCSHRAIHDWWERARSI